MYRTIVCLCYDKKVKETNKQKTMENYEKLTEIRFIEKVGQMGFLNCW